MNAPVTLETGLAHQRAGRLGDAATAYEQVLENDPNNADCLHLLGLVEFQLGNIADALEYLGRAVEINGKAAPVLNAREGTKTLAATLAVKESAASGGMIRLE